MCDSKRALKARATGGRKLGTDKIQNYITLCNFNPFFIYVRIHWRIIRRASLTTYSILYPYKNKDYFILNSLRPYVHLVHNIHTMMIEPTFTSQ